MRPEIVTDPPEEAWQSFVTSHLVVYPHQNPFLKLPARHEQLLGFRSANGTWMGYCFLQLKKANACHIQFGPVAASLTDSFTILSCLIPFLKRQRKTRLSVQLPFLDDAQSAQELAAFRNSVAFRHSHYVLNWSSLIKDITMEDAALFSSFSAHHRRNIRKAQKAGVSYRLLQVEEEVTCLLDIFAKMYRQRRQLMPTTSFMPHPLRLLSRDQPHAHGFVVGSFWKNRLVGGIALVRCGHTAFYLMGASDPAVRHVPVLHGAFYFAMQQARLLGMRQFDLGGFDPTAHPDSQVGCINRFKQGFCAQSITFLPQLIFDLNKPISWLIEAALALRSYLRR